MAPTSVLLALLSLILRINPSNESGHGTHKLLVVVCNGFRYDYLSLAKSRGIRTPTFDRIIREGVRAGHMKPEFVTATYPNLWSLVTGLTVENHGIVHDQFYDPESRRIFNGLTVESAQFYLSGINEKKEGAPIWITNQLSSGRSVLSSWPAAGLTVDHARASYIQHAELSVPVKDRINFIIRHLKARANPANLGLMFLDEPGEYVSRIYSLMITALL